MLAAILLAPRTVPPHDTTQTYGNPLNKGGWDACFRSRSRSLCRAGGTSLCCLCRLQRGPKGREEEEEEEVVEEEEGGLREGEATVWPPSRCRLVHTHRLHI